MLRQAPWYVGLSICLVWVSVLLTMLSWRRHVDNNEKRQSLSSSSSSSMCLCAIVSVSAALGSMLPRDGVPLTLPPCGDAGRLCRPVSVHLEHLRGHQEWTSAIRPRMHEFISYLGSHAHHLQCACCDGRNRGHHTHNFDQITCSRHYQNVRRLVNENTIREHSRFRALFWQEVHTKAGEGFRFNHLDGTIEWFRGDTPPLPWESPPPSPLLAALAPSTANDMTQEAVRIARRWTRWRHDASTKSTNHRWRFPLLELQWKH